MKEKPPAKIILVGPLYPFRGGIAHFLEAIYRGLLQRGHTVEAITFTTQYPAFLFPGKTQYETHPPSDPPLARRLIHSLNPLSWIKAARYIAAQQPDLVVFNYWMSFFAPAFGTMVRWLRRRGIRTAVVVHNALPHERKPGDLLLGRFFFRAVQGGIVLSESVRKDLERLGAKVPVRQVAHPVYDIFGKAPPQATVRATLKIPEKAPVLLFFGFVRRYKGLEVLLKSLPEVIAALPDVLLVVAGEFYEEEEACRQFIRQNHLEDHVRLHADYIANEEVATFFSAADVVVQPYLSATQSGVAQIAFHFEKPVILTDVGGLAEVVPHEKAGLVVPPADPSALAAAIIRFFKEDLAQQLAEGVREEKKKYGWEALYEAIESFLPEPSA